MNSTGEVIQTENMNMGLLGNYNYNLYLGNLTSGDYNLRVNATDNTGNVESKSKSITIQDNVAPVGDITAVNSNVPVSTGGTVTFMFPLSVRGNGTIVFSMDDIAGITPSGLNATISSGNQTVAVGRGANFTGAQTLTLADSNPSVPNVQANVVLTLQVPPNMTPGAYSINYYIDNA
jgi:hypothetical protein